MGYQEIMRRDIAVVDECGDRIFTLAEEQRQFARRSLVVKLAPGRSSASLLGFR